MKVVVTGANGFIGSKLLSMLASYDVFIIGRNISNKVEPHCFFYSNLDKDDDFYDVLCDSSIVIHCAGRVHIMSNTSLNSLEEFKEVNTHGTLNLAKQAADAGVKRFIFISSIKVNGESTELGRPFEADTNFITSDPYGLSKYEAEVGLRNIAEQTSMEVVIIRPPLVYGPGVKANFATMMKWVNKGLPLPLGGIKENKRSLVSVDNLVDLIVTCMEHPKAANQTFLASDDNDVSTTGLLVDMATALNAPSRLLPVPASWFNFIAGLINKPAVSQRLCGSLQVDISKTKVLLNWTPPYSSAESMKKTANAFLENLSSNKSLHK